jgi:hypothetical protein
MPLMVKTLLESLGKLQLMMLAEGSKEKTQDFILTDIAPTRRRHLLPMEQPRETKSSQDSVTPRDAKRK